MESIGKINITQLILSFIMIGLLSFQSCKPNQVKKENLVLAKEAYQERLASEENPQLIDVRTPEEFQNGFIEGAVNYDFLDGTFQENINKLNPEKTVFIYCAGGGRSAKAASLLKEKGFKSIIDLQGGYSHWKKDK